RRLDPAQNEVSRSQVDERALLERQCHIARCRTLAAVAADENLGTGRRVDDAVVAAAGDELEALADRLIVEAKFSVRRGTDLDARPRLEGAHVDDRVTPEQRDLQDAVLSGRTLVGTELLIEESIPVRTERERSPKRAALRVAQRAILAGFGVLFVGATHLVAS